MIDQVSLGSVTYTRKGSSVLDLIYVLWGVLDVLFIHPHSATGHFQSWPETCHA